MKHKIISSEELRVGGSWSPRDHLDPAWIEHYWTVTAALELEAGGAGC